MQSHIKLAPRAPVSLPIPVPAGIRVIWCDTCGSFMPHALSKSQSHYFCSCGEAIVYYINNAPALWAIR